jgi:ankyrin repeat protein
MFIAGPNRPDGAVSAIGGFVYKPCSPGIVGHVWCRNYEWEWWVPTFLPRRDDVFPLETAVAAGDRRQVEALIHAGTNVNAMGPVGETAIWSARTPEVAKMLVAAGASVEAPADGFTALMSAVRGHDLGTVQALLAVGANPNARDDAGCTPLLHALHAPLFRQDVPSTALIAELLRAGAQVNVKDREGLAPLMKAVQGGWPDIVRMLLGARADVNARNNKGATALSMAEQHGETEIVGLLQKAGARP